MRCKSCDYPLWNLASRLCPECGTPFLPSDFDFALNSVRFRCPHCAQDYYGTGERGHLVPAEFECVRCARHITMDQMLLLPAEGVDEDRTIAERSPWLDRRRLGFFRAWMRTIFWAMFRPGRLMRATPQESRVGAAAGFAALTCGAYATFGGGLMTIALAALVGAFGGMRSFSGAVFIPMLWLAGYFVGLALFTGIWILIAHGLLLATGRTAAGIERTAQAILYSAAVNVVPIIPCLGAYFWWAGLIWWAATAAIMAVEAQKVGGWRAALTVAGPPLGLVGLAAGAIFLALMGLASTASTAAIQQQQALAAATAPARAQVVLDALLDYPRENGGAWPADPALLLTSGSLTFTDSLDTGTESFPISPRPSPPDGTIARRVGDVVFTYPGIDPSAADPGLWVLVWSRRTSGRGTASAAVVPVGTLGGSVTPIAGAAFADALAEQNRLRAEAGLPPLPDPATVTEFATGP